MAFLRGALASMSGCLPSLPPLQANLPPGLREILSGQGLFSPEQPRWPSNVSFPILLSVIEGATSLNRMAVNIGGHDGMTHDPVYPLFKAGYGGLVIEPDFKRQREALPRNLGTVNSSGLVRIQWGFASTSSIGRDLSAAAIPKDLDALKVDIDSFDLPVLQAILQADFRPKVLMVEINSDVPPPIKWTLQPPPANGHFMRRGRNLYGGYFGTSADAVFQALAAFDNSYSLVAFELGDSCEGKTASCCIACEHNMWFVRSDMLGLPRGTALTGWTHMVQMYWYQLSAMVAAMHHHRIGSLKAADREKVAAGWYQLAGPLSQNLSSGATPATDWVGSTYFGARHAWHWCVHMSPCPVDLITHMPERALQNLGVSDECRAPGMAAADEPQAVSTSSGKVHAPWHERAARLFALASVRLASYDGACQAAEGIARSLAQAHCGGDCLFDVGIAPDLKCT